MQLLWLRKKTKDEVESKISSPAQAISLSFRFRNFLLKTKTKKNMGRIGLDSSLKYQEFSFITDYTDKRILCY